MSQQRASDFVTALLQNPGLMAQVLAEAGIPDADVVEDRHLAIAAAAGKREGYDFTPAELGQAIQQARAAMTKGGESPRELSEAELDLVAAGDPQSCSGGSKGNA